MNDLIQEHKRFLIALVVGALGFLLLWLITNAIFNGDIRRARLSIQKAQADKARAVSAQALSRVQGDARKAEAALGTLMKSVDRVPAKEFILAEGESSPDLRYNQVRERMRTEQVERCAIKNIDVDPDLGTPDAFPTTRREFDWYLRGLDVVRQVLDQVLEIDEKVQERGIARIDRIEMQPCPKARVTGPPAFLEDHKVTFVIAGHPKAVYALVESLGRKRDDGRFLEIASGTVRSLDLPPGAGLKGARSADPADRERVEAKLELVAVEVNADGKLGRKGSTAP